MLKSGAKGWFFCRIKPVIYVDAGAVGVGEKGKEVEAAESFATAVGAERGFCSGFAEGWGILSGRIVFGERTAVSRDVRGKT